MLKELTEKYIEAFDSKNLDKCAELFTENSTLEDPVVRRIEGKVEVLKAIKSIFDSCTKLDFSAKKKSLKARINKNRNKQLSSFAYSKIIELIKARAEDNFIEVREVNPAYTSMIGSIKYSVRSRINVHHGAATCIGRKGLFNKEKTIKVLDKETNKEVNKKVIKEYVEKRISSRNRQIKSSNLPERNNLNSVVYWKELKENMVKEKQHEMMSSSNVASQSTSLRNSNEPVMNASVGTLS
jgi:hypothetical protein